MQLHLTLTHILDPRGEVKRSFFSESSHVTYQINGNEEHNASKYFALLYTNHPWNGSKGHLFSEGHVAYQMAFWVG